MINKKLMRFSILCFLLFPTVVMSQEIPTTFILLRHAEKDMKQSTNDPDLSAEGKNRAQRLSEMLKKTHITAIYSSAFKRTFQTVEPLAKSKGLSIQTYAPNEDEDIERMLEKNRGGTVVVAGHSNTIPRFVNYLLAETKYTTFEDNEYDNLLLVTVVEQGTGVKVVKVVWIKTD